MTIWQPALHAFGTLPVVHYIPLPCVPNEHFALCAYCVPCPCASHYLASCAHEVLCPLCPQNTLPFMPFIPLPFVPTNTLPSVPVSDLPFVPIKRPALCAHQATCPLCLSYLKLASQVLGVPHSSREPALHQLLVGIPARRQGLCKGGQAKGEVIGQVVPNCGLVTVTHHLKDCCKACNGTDLCGDKVCNKGQAK